MFQWVRGYMSRATLQEMSQCWPLGLTLYSKMPRVQQRRKSTHCARLGSVISSKHLLTDSEQAIAEMVAGRDMAMFDLRDIHTVVGH